MVHMWVWLKFICSWRYEPHLKCRGSYKDSQWKCKYMTYEYPYPLRTQSISDPVWISISTMTFIPIYYDILSISTMTFIHIHYDLYPYPLWPLFISTLTFIHIHFDLYPYPLWPLSISTITSIHIHLYYDLYPYLLRPLSISTMTFIHIHFDLYPYPLWPNPYPLWPTISCMTSIHIYYDLSISAMTSIYPYPLWVSISTMTYMIYIHILQDLNDHRSSQADILIVRIVIIFIIIEWNV